MSAISAYPVPVSLLTIRKLAVAKWVGYFALADLLLFPYFQWIIMPFSLPVVLLAAAFLGTKIEKDRDLFLFGVFAVPAVLSVGISLFIPQSLDYAPENLKRILQLLSSFAYYFYFRWLAAATPLRIAPIVWIFIVWFAFLAAMFVTNPLQTNEFIRAIYGRLVISDDSVTSHLRFAYVFTDPNTAAYFFLIVASVLLTGRRSFLSLTTLAAFLFGIVVVTQSKGAMIALALMLLTTVYPPSQLRSLLNIRRMIGLLAIGAVAFGVFVYISSVTEHNSVAKLAFERLFNSPENYARGGSRFEIWSRFFHFFLPLPFGRGYTLVIQGSPQGPHSDLLRLIFSYGFIALVPFVALLFRRIVALTPLMVPALMAFLINSLLDEQKLLATYLSLFAIQVVACRQRAAATAYVPRNRDPDRIVAP